MLKEQIKKDTIEAMKAKNSELAGVLRLASAAISSKEKEKRYQEKLETDVILTDEEVVGVLASEVKKRRDAIALYEQGGRPELAETEKAEIAILQKYLPKQLSGEELKKMVVAAVEKTEAKEMKDMGKVMAELNPQIKGRADGGEVSKIVKELLVK